MADDQFNQTVVLRLQMEENRRKYVQQALASQLRTPQQLSVQKVNQLKARLGLVQQAGPMVKINHRKRSEMEPIKDEEISSNYQQVAAPSEARAAHKAPAFEPKTSEAELEGGNSFLASQQSLDNQQGPMRAGGTQLIGAPLSTIPKTDFECTDRRGRFVAGLFADTKTGCQVWHLCSNNRKYSFLCPSGTIFNAKLRICDWRYNVKCENALQTTARSAAAS